MKSLHWRIVATILLFLLAAGVNFTDFNAQKVFRDASRLIGEENALGISAVHFVHSVWIGSELWLLLWVPLFLALLFTWIPKLDWIGAIFSLLSTVLVASSLYFIPMAGWITASSLATEMARDAEERFESNARESGPSD